MFLYQTLTRGWNDSELWSLDYSLSKLILPRLKRFRKVTGSYPTDLNSLDEWREELDKMIYSFSFLASEKRWDCYDEKVWNQVQEGLELFSRRYTNLWW